MSVWIKRMEQITKHSLKLFHNSFNRLQKRVRASRDATEPPETTLRRCIPDALRNLLKRRIFVAQAPKNVARRKIVLAVCKIGC